MAPRPSSTALVAAVFFALVLPARAAPVPSRTGDPVLDVLLMTADLEKRHVAEDLEDFDRISAQTLRLEADLGEALSQVARLARESVLDRQALDQAEQAVVDARAHALVSEERRQAVADRLAEHLRRLTGMRDEVARRRDFLKSGASDPLSGKWDVVINPGARHGVYRLSLDGTILAGDYVLDGGFHGSLRGTFVSDRVMLERVDSERGVDAKFYGRLTYAPARRIAGTWEGTQIAPAPAGPVAGTWAAQPTREEDSDSR